MWPRACQLEVERTSVHGHLHGDERGLKLPRLREQQEKSDFHHRSPAHHKTKRVHALYFAYEVVCVFPPHIRVGGHIHGPGLERSQHPRVWQDKEGRTFPVGQQAAHKF